jgi:hypothetical protein
MDSTHPDQEKIHTAKDQRRQEREKIRNDEQQMRSEQRNAARPKVPNNANSQDKEFFRKEQRRLDRQKKEEGDASRHLKRQEHLAKIKARRQEKLDNMATPEERDDYLKRMDEADKRRDEAQQKRHDRRNSVSATTTGADSSSDEEL